MEIYVQIFYKYNGQNHNELTISQSCLQQDIQEVTLKNDLCEEMFKTRDFDEFVQFIKDLKEGKYANRKAE